MKNLLFILLCGVSSFAFSQSDNLTSDTIYLKTGDKYIGYLVAEEVTTYEFKLPNSKKLTSIPKGDVLKIARSGGESVNSKVNKQGLFPVNNNGEIEYTEVVKVDSTSADVLYSRAKMTIAQSFKSAKNVIQKIYNYDFSKNKRLERTRDLFIVGCYTGLRFSDFSQLTSDNIKSELITVKTQKTGEKVVIPLHWTVKNILAKYSETAKGLPRDLSNQRMNDYLKEIGREVKIDEQIHRTQSKDGLKVSKNVSKWELITTHTARRSFATNLYKSGFPSIAIMKITGHRTEKSFMKYIKISLEENANFLQAHWNANVKLKVL